MHALAERQEDPSPPLEPPPTLALPPAVHAAVWRGSELGGQAQSVVSSGFAALDRELPGGGWPRKSLTELLQPQPAVLEWRLLGPALQAVVAAGQSVVVVGPPRHPHLPGLRHAGIDERQLIWVRADAPSERLWCTEQLIKSNATGALVAWLPQARPEQIRRLQVCAQSCEGPVFLCRPLAARHESSAAPLRVIATLAPDWELHVQVLKRRGPAHEGTASLRSLPGGLAAVITPRLARPSRLLVREVPADAVGSTAPSARPRRHAAAH